GEHFGPVDDHRLSRVSLGHSHAETLKARADLGEDAFIQRQPPSQRPRYYFPRNVVLSWAESAGSDDHARAFDCVFDQFFQTRVIVADDRLELNVDAYAIELVGEPETVGVGAIRSQQFRADGNDFSSEH